MNRMGKTISDNHKTISPQELSQAISGLLPLYWEDRIPGDVLKSIYENWFNALRDHTFKTVRAACDYWVRSGTRRPTPAEILNLCHDTDPTPARLERWRAMRLLPIVDPEPEIDTGPPPVGDVIELGRMMRFAPEHGIVFPEAEQIAYLETGKIPDWWRPNPPPTPDNPTPDPVPTREQILASMTPEQRAAAVNGSTGTYNGK